MRNDLVFDLFVHPLGQNSFRDQLIFRPIGTPRDNSLRIAIADARQNFQLVFRGRVDVQFVRVRPCCGHGSGLTRAGRRRQRPGRRHDRKRENKTYRTDYKTDSLLKVHRISLQCNRNFHSPTTVMTATMPRQRETLPVGKSQ